MTFNVHDSMGAEIEGVYGKTVVYDKQGEPIGYVRAVKVYHGNAIIEVNLFLGKAEDFISELLRP